MSPSLVTVIVPTYNYGNLIGQTLQNIQAQTYQYWECRVVDDGSTDRTRDEVKLYVEQDSRIHYLSQTNQGPAAARNNGLRHNLGKYVQFWDADDFAERRKIEQQVAYLDQHPEVDIVYGSVRYFRSDNPDERRYSMENPDRRWMPETSGKGKDILAALIKDCIMVINAPLIRRTVIEEVGELDNSLGAHEDWDYWIRCAAKGKRFQYLDAKETAVLVRWHQASLSRDEPRITTALSRLRRKINTIVTDPELLTLNRKLAAGFEGYVGIRQIKEGRRAKGMWQFLKAAVMSRTAKEKMKWIFCALLAAFAPRDQFDNFVAMPIRKSLAGVIRRRR
jgi:glycosyltransferase involved in cell wall biosynthesis